MPLGTPYLDQQDDPNSYLVTNTSSGSASYEAGSTYVGPVPGLTSELIYAGTQPNLNITSYVPNAFIHTGSGSDAIDVSLTSGNCVLDGGSGSNFLTGQIAGNPDQFYLDDRQPAAVTWSTIVNFHAGEGATVWGVTPQDFTLTWLDGQGAAGYTGLTAVFTAPGVPESGITLTGFTSADLNNGKLAISYGTTPSDNGVPGSAYMHIQAV
jgi:hypothetical protein